MLKGENTNFDDFDSWFSAKDCLGGDNELVTRLHDVSFHSAHSASCVIVCTT
jgi:hypothetical protein